MNSLVLEACMKKDPILRNLFIGFFARDELPENKLKKYHIVSLLIQIHAIIRGTLVGIFHR
jgi:hypothetical protein